MAIIQAILAYRPHGIGSEHAVPIGATDDSRVLRQLRDALLDEAHREASRWRDIDPGVFAMRLGDYKRLRRLLALLLPDEDLRPDLRILKPMSVPTEEDPEL